MNNVCAHTNFFFFHRVHNMHMSIFFIWVRQVFHLCVSFLFFALKKKFFSLSLSLFFITGNISFPTKWHGVYLITKCLKLNNNPCGWVFMRFCRTHKWWWRRKKSGYFWKWPNGFFFFFLRKLFKRINFESEKRGIAYYLKA